MFRLNLLHLILIPLGVSSTKMDKHMNMKPIQISSTNQYCIGLVEEKPRFTPHKASLGSPKIVTNPYYLSVLPDKQSTSFGELVFRQASTQLEHPYRITEIQLQLPAQHQIDERMSAAEILLVAQPRPVVKTQATRNIRRGQDWIEKRDSTRTEMSMSSSMKPLVVHFLVDKTARENSALFESIMAEKDLEFNEITNLIEGADFHSYQGLQLQLQGQPKMATHVVYLSKIKISPQQFQKLQGLQLNSMRGTHYATGHLLQNSIFSEDCVFSNELPNWFVILIVIGCLTCCLGSFAVVFLGLIKYNGRLPCNKRESRSPAVGLSTVV